MRLPRLRRRWWIALGAASITLGAGAAAFSPIVRGRVAEEARRRNLEIDVGGVRPGWFAVRLIDVQVRAIGVEGASLHLDEVRVDVSAGLRPRAVSLRGGEVSLQGAPRTLTDQLRTWRARSEGGAEAAHGGSLPVRVEGVALHWSIPAGEELSQLEATGVGATRDESGTSLFAGTIDARVREADVHVEGGSATFEHGALRALRAAKLDCSWAVSPAPDAVEPPPPNPQDPTPVVARVGETPAARTPHAARGAPPPAPPFEPLVPMPRLHALRARADQVAAVIADRLPPDTEVSVEQLSLHAKQGDGESIDAGPGPLTIARREGRFEVRFSTEPGASGTPLALRADLPLSLADDVQLSVEGGPVPLALLGLRDGTAGLVDVDRATVAGKGRIVLAGAGDALTFDGEVRFRGVGMKQPRIAHDVVHGLDLGLRARGAVDDHGQVRLDDLGVAMGALHVDGSGVLVQADDYLTASFQIDVPSASCQSLFESVPTAILPTLAGTKFEGTLAARGRFSIDTRKLDDALIDYDVADACRVVEVPEHLARDRFKKPFQHRIYLPDGSTSEETTGPGTSKWVPVGGVSPFMQVAVLTTEDGGFYHHHGFSHGAIKASIIANLKARRFVRGASTISMQLAKNLFLEREKTLSRKFEEMILTDYLEQVFSKEELMELYLNVIEFGPKVYGIGPASYFYFGRSPGELNLAECLFLSSMLPNPLKLSGLRGGGQLNDGWQHTIQHLMEIAHRNGLISDAELEDGKNEIVVFHNTGSRGFAQRHPDPIGDDGTMTAHEDSAVDPEQTPKPN